MKLRIFKNSLRFRLDEEDIIFFKKNNFIFSEIFLGNTIKSIFKYSIQPYNGLKIKIEYNIDGIKIFIPEGELLIFLNKNKKHIMKNIPLKNDKSLRIIIEQDLFC